MLIMNVSGTEMISNQMKGLRREHTYKESIMICRYCKGRGGYFYAHSPNHPEYRTKAWPWWTCSECEGTGIDREATDKKEADERT